jgi:hypothetical protein
MFSLLGVDYARQRLENATRRAERAAQIRAAVGTVRPRVAGTAGSRVRLFRREPACVLAAWPGRALQCVNAAQAAPSCC